MDDNISIDNFCADYENKKDISVKEMEKKYGLTRAHITNKARQFGLKLRRPRKNWIK